MNQVSQHKKNSVNVLTANNELIGDDHKGDGSGETNRPVPVAKFGTFVSEYHAHGNQKFFSKFQARLV